MDEDSKKEWGARIERARPAVVWLRTVGSGSTLFGMIGVMQTFFWPSVTAVYVGLSLFAIDAFFERFARAVKCFIFSALVCFGVLFTHQVVRHKDPLSLSYRVAGERLDLIIRNASNDDYRDLDVKIAPESRDHIFVGRVVPLDDYPEFRIVTNADQVPGNEEKLYRYDGTNWIAYPNRLRIRCTTFPRQTSIRMSVELIKAGQNHQGLVPVHPDSTPTLKGTSTGKYRTVDVAASFQKQ